MNTYLVKYKDEPADLDADWNKAFWRSVESIKIDQAHPASSDWRPCTQVKMAYNNNTVYVFFSIQDKYVRACATQTHGEVWKDSCVEFFFAAELNKPESYFNIEINCCGILLAQHHTGPRENSRYLDIEDCRKIRIASSTSGPILNEISTPITWTLEYALPLEIFCKYADFQMPASGVTWHGNFYKCADNSSHPHWLSWSPVLSKEPDFHRPDCFGKLVFM